MALSTFQGPAGFTVGFLARRSVLDAVILLHFQHTHTQKSAQFWLLAQTKLERNRAAASVLKLV